MAFTEKEIIAKLGPLAALAGTWEGQKGDDTAPSDDRGTEKNLFKERMVFTPFGPVDNHEQQLWGLRYSTTAWRLDEDDAFHEELGYWLWDPKREEVYRCFLVPRGVALIAGGKAKADSKSFRLEADCGSETFGICSNPFLDEEFKTVRYELTVTLNEDGSLSYDEDTQLKMKGKDTLFHHRDQSQLTLI